MALTHLDGLVKRLVENPHDEEAVNAAYESGKTDPRGYAVFLERVGAATGDPAIASHWLNQAAGAWLSLNDAGRAALLMMKAVERCPLDPAPAERLAELYREKGERKGLAALLDRRVKTLTPVAENDEVVRGQLALIHEELGQLWSEAPLSNPARAMAHLQTAIELDKGRHFAIYTLRELLKRKERFHDAIPLFQMEYALTEDPDRRHALLLDEASVRHLAGDLTGASEALREAMRIGGADAAAQAQLAGLVLQRVQAGETVSDSERDEAVGLYVGLAESFPGPEHGLPYLLCALEMDPSQAGALNQAMAFARGSGREQEVSERALSFLSSDPATDAAETARQWLLLHPATTPESPASQSDASPEVLADALDEIPMEDTEQKERAESALAAGSPAGAAPPPVLGDVERLLEEADGLARRAKKREAAAVYQAVLEFQPWNDRAVMFLRGFLRQTRMFTELRDMLLLAGRSAEAPADFRARCAREAAGLCESQLRDTDGAVNAWRELLNLVPDDEVGATQLRRLLERAERWDELASFIEEQAVQAGDVEVRIALERSLAKLHDEKRSDALRAGEAWARIAGLVAGDDEAIFSALERFENASAPELAAQVIEDNLDGVPEDATRAELYGRLGELRSASGDALGAGDAWFEAAGITKEEELWGAAESAYVQAEAWAQAATAIAERAEFAESASDQAVLIAQEAEYLTRAGDEEHATTRLSVAAELAPGDERLSERYVERLSARGEQREAVAFLLQRVERLSSPEQRQGLLRRAADIHRALSDEPAAIRCLERVIEEGDDVLALRELAGHAEATGDYHGAVTLLDRLGNATVDPEQQLDVFIHQAELYATVLEDVEEAIRRYERILSVVDSNSSDALRAIAHLHEGQQNPSGQANALERLLLLAETPSTQSELARRLADLYSHLEDAERTAKALEKLVEIEPADREALSRLRHAYVSLEAWPSVAQTLGKLIDIEEDGAALSLETRELASVLARHLQKPEEALQKLVALADAGDKNSRNAAVDLADGLGGREQWVGEKILAWSATTSGEERVHALAAAFERFLAAGADEPAIFVAKELVRAKSADLTLAQSLEVIATRAKDLDALGISHDLLVEPLEAGERAVEWVRQAEVMIEAGGTPKEAVGRGELGLAGLAGADAQPLVERLSALCADTAEKIALHDRQVGRCQTSVERIDALANAAQVAAELGASDPSREFFARGLEEVSQGGDVEQLIRIARRTDETNQSTSLRTLMAESLANAPGARDGGRTRASWLVRAAELAHGELGDTERAFEWAEEALLLHPDAATLDVLLTTAEALSDLPRAERALNKALEEVFDGPAVRGLLSGRAALRRDRLENPTGAAKDLKRLYDLSPGDAGVLSELDALYQSLGDHRGIVELYEDQMLRGKDPEVRAEIARKVAKIWESELADHREAADAWRRVLRMKKGDVEAKDGLERAKAGMRERRSLMPPSPPPPVLTQSPERVREAPGAWGGTAPVTRAVPPPPPSFTGSDPILAKGGSPGYKAVPPPPPSFTGSEGVPIVLTPPPAPALTSEVTLPEAPVMSAAAGEQALAPAVSEPESAALSELGPMHEVGGDGATVMEAPSSPTASDPAGVFPDAADATKDSPHARQLDSAELDELPDSIEPSLAPSSEPLPTQAVAGMASDAPDGTSALPASAGLELDEEDIDLFVDEDGEDEEPSLPVTGG